MTYSYDQPSDSADSNSKTSAKRNTSQKNQLFNTNNSDLQSQINTLKQEVNLLVKQVNQLTLYSLRKPYQLLGVRFDDVSRQWLADIKLDNNIQSLKSGETFEGWHVVSVDSEGARIE